MFSMETVEPRLEGHPSHPDFNLNVVIMGMRTLTLTDSNLSAVAAMALFLSVQVRKSVSSLFWRVVLCRPIALGLVALYYAFLVVRSNLLSWIVIEVIIPAAQRLVE